MKTRTKSLTSIISASEISEFAILRFKEEYPEFEAGKVKVSRGPNGSYHVSGTLDFAGEDLVQSEEPKPTPAIWCWMLSANKPSMSHHKNHKLKAGDLIQLSYHNTSNWPPMLKRVGDVNAYGGVYVRDADGDLSLVSFFGEQWWGDSGSCVSEVKLVSLADNSEPKTESPEQSSEDPEPTIKSWELDALDPGLMSHDHGLKIGDVIRLHYRDWKKSDPATATITNLDFDGDVYIAGAAGAVNTMISFEGCGRDPGAGVASVDLVRMVGDVVSEAGAKDPEQDNPDPKPKALSWVLDGLEFDDMEDHEGHGLKAGDTIELTYCDGRKAKQFVIERVGDEYKDVFLSNGFYITNYSSTEPFDNEAVRLVTLVRRAGEL